MYVQHFVCLPEKLINILLYRHYKACRSVSEENESCIYIYIYQHDKPLRNNREYIYIHKLIRKNEDELKMQTEKIRQGIHHNNAARISQPRPCSTFAMQKKNLNL